MTPVSNQGYWLKVEEPYLSELAVVLLHEGSVDRDLCGREGRCGDEVEGGVAGLCGSISMSSDGCINAYPTSFRASQRKGFSKL